MQPPSALTRRSNKRAALLELGAAHVIATEEEDLVDAVQKITSGKGARVVFDPVGGPTVAKLTAAMAEHGILLLYGALSTEPTPVPLFDVLAKLLDNPRLRPVRDHGRSSAARADQKIHHRRLIHR